MHITWLPQKRDYFIAYAVTILIGLLLTQPSDCRGRRWVQILISLGVVHLVIGADDGVRRVGAHARGAERVVGADLEVARA